MDGLELASAVSTEETYEVGDPASPVRIAVLDYGVKKNIVQCMVERGAFVKVFPAKTAADDPEGIQSFRLFSFQWPRRSRSDGLCRGNRKRNPERKKAVVRHLSGTSAAGTGQWISRLLKCTMATAD